MVITVIDGRVDRFHSEEIGLNLFQFLKICVKSAHGFAAVRIFLLPTFLIPIDIVGI